MSLHKVGYGLPLFLATLYFFINPFATEHAEFALALGGYTPFTVHNGFYRLITSESSSQIVIPLLLLKLGLNKYLVQALFTYISIAVPFFAIWEYCSKKGNGAYTYVFLVALFSVASIPNFYFYPFSFPGGFFNFGNLGMWTTVLFVGLLLNERKIAYILYGFMLSWHPSWFICATLALISVQTYQDIKKNNLLIFSGLFLSFFFMVIGKYYQSELYSSFALEQSSFFDGLYDDIFNFKKMIDGSFTAHNPVIFNGDTSNTLRIVIEMIAPIILVAIFPAQKEFQKLSYKFKKFMFLNTVVVIGALLFLELARIVPLPLVSIVQRLILNRFLNINLVLLIIYIVIELGCFEKNQWRNLYKIFLAMILIYITDPVSDLKYAFYPSMILYILVSNRTFKFLNNWKGKILGSILISGPMIAYATSLQANRYDAFSFWRLESDQVLSELKAANESQIILGPMVQGVNGMSIALYTNSAFYVLNDLRFSWNGESKKVYCFEENNKNLAKLAIDCFENRPNQEWREIFEQLNASMVVVPSGVKLNLNLVAKNSLYAIYKY